MGTKMTWGEVAGETPSRRELLRTYSVNQCRFFRGLDRGLDGRI